ncbi:MAG: ribbon-helix-helix protein, CopG family [Candidatus Hadarchaeales archaeon]
MKNRREWASYVEDKLVSMAIAEEMEKEERRNAVTVRLTADTVRLIDQLANRLGLSRQALLQDIIRVTAVDIAQAFAEQFENSQEVFRELMSRQANDDEGGNK